MGKRYTIRMEYEAEILLDDNDIKATIDAEAYAHELFKDMLVDDIVYADIYTINTEDVNDDDVYQEVRI